MKTNFYLLTATALIFCFSYFSQTKVSAQNPNLLYGVTSQGGTEGEGVIFHIDKSTGMQTVDFSFTSNQGTTPIGSFTLKGEKFYGMTRDGGANNLGVIFEWNPVTNTYTKKIDFDGAVKGSYPDGALTYFNGKFYGMTFKGGLYDAGVIFEWDPITNYYTKKIDFDGASMGEGPEESMTFYNGKFYGITWRGGTFDMGIIFEWDPVTNIYARKIDFDGALKGSFPEGCLTLRGSKLYGMAAWGGVNGMGVIFEWDPATNYFIKKIDFNGTEGMGPMGNLTLRNGIFFGMTPIGGVINKGVIFEWDPINNIFIKRIDFDSIATGKLPYGSLTLNNGNFYGMTHSGGTINKGVIFEWDPSVSNTFTKLVDFNTINGSHPYYTQLAVYNDSTTAAQATNLYFHNVQNTQMNINWLDGSGDKRTVFIKQGTDGTALPVNNSTYVANTTFGSGTQIGSTGWYCVFNGTGHNAGVTVTNLLNNNAYRVMVCEYTGNAGFEQYNDSTAEGNPATQTAGTYFVVGTTSNPTAGGNTLGGGSYLSGVQATVTATPNTGYNFVNWTENGNIVSTNPAYTFTVTGNTSLVANFVLQQYNISTSSNPSAGGTTSGSGTFSYGVQATVMATPNTGYNFVNWTENGNVVSTNVAYSFTVTAARSLVANFVLLQYTISTSANPATAGITSGGGVFNYGAQAIVNATPNTNWTFLNWTENGNIVSTSPQYTFTVVADRILVANFTQSPVYFIATSSNPASGGLTTGGGNYFMGASVTVTGTANTGYNFTYWTENGNVVSTDTAYSFTVTGARNLVANFELQQYSVSTTANPASGGSTSGDGIYSFGELATVIATANTNWTFLNWTENGNVVSTLPEYSFTVAANRSLLANYTQLLTYLVTTASSPANGGTTSGGGNYVSGQPATAAAVCNTGYGFTNWTENGNVVSADSVYTFTVTANTNLLANFEAQKFPVTTITIPEGSGSTSGDGIYPYGSTATVFASSGKSWAFYEWTENCNPVSANTSYSFTVTSGRELAAVFYQPGIQYVTTTIASPPEGGYVTGCGTYYIDSMATVNAIAYPGWEFVNWTEGGSAISTDATYAYLVSNHRSLTANFHLYAGIVKPEMSSIRVFPNPAKDKLFVEWDNALTQKFDEVTLFNTLSQIVYRQRTGNVSGKITIDVESFTPGMYLLVLSTKGQKIADYKVVVEP